VSFRPCVLIPCYEHGYALPTLVERLHGFGLPIIIVDDGSRDGSPAVLAELATSFPLVVPLYRPRNGGKGEALRDGINRAGELGFTHAVCLDSDGQHAAADVPRFIEAARAAPSALILGAPHFGPEAPLVRRIGREFSNIAVAIATVSLKARDVLCGFRVYPVRGLLEEVGLSSVSAGMGFDAEVVVRSVWAGLPVVNVPTKVEYPANGVSHFRGWSDTLALMKLEARLIAQGILMLPGRMAGRIGQACKKGYRHWSQIPERGSLAGLRLLLRIFELLGRGPLMVVMVPVMAYMFLAAGFARRAAIDFQAQLLVWLGQQASRRTVCMRAFRQFWEFGSATVDRVLSWRLGVTRDRFAFEGLEEFQQATRSPRGVVFMGAHVGNIDVLRAFGDIRNVAINAIMFTQGSRKLHRFLEEVSDRTFIRVIEVKEVDSSLIFELQACLHRGEVVAMLADRASANTAGRVREIPFLGRGAPFPEGPWILASLLDAPVFTGFCMREARRRYRVEFRKLAERVELPRSNRQEALRQVMTSYAARLEDIVRRYPCQWFNFFPFWSGVESAPEQEQRARDAING